MDRLTVRIGGEEQVLARVEIRDGRRAKVWLGPRRRIDPLNIRDGDRVTVTGVRVRVNERPILLAQRLSTSGQAITNDLPRGGDMRVVRGELVSTETRRFRNRDGRFVVARIRPEDGGARPVILGRQQRLDQLDLRPGDTVTVLGQPARLNGRPATLAERLATRHQKLNVMQARSRSEEASRAGRRTGGRG